MMPGWPNIEQFYDADPRRRESAEQLFGNVWRDANDPGHQYDLAWIEGTGELYVMRKPVPAGPEPVPVEDDIINLGRDLRDVVETTGDVGHWIADHLHPRHLRAKNGTGVTRHRDAYEEELQVEVLARIGTLEQVEQALAGWQDHAGGPDGLAWVRAAAASGA